MSHSKQVDTKTYDIFTQTLEGFAGEYDIDLQIFGDHGFHWRLNGVSAVCDFWPTTGKYWIKDPPLNGFMKKHGRTGRLPQSYNGLAKWLYDLFDIKLEDRQ